MLSNDHDMEKKQRFLLSEHNTAINNAKAHRLSITLKEQLSEEQIKRILLEADKKI